MNAIVPGSGWGLPTDHSVEGGIVVIEVREGGTVEMPAGRWVLGADFVRQGPDLLLIGEGGERVLLKGYFALAEAPDLVLADGARLDGDLVLKLAGPAAPAEVAQAGPAATAEAIGRVETVEGTVTVRHADGSEATLHKGDPVFQGDVLETGSTGVIGVVFADDSTFSLAQDARMTLDEMVYDPGAQVGSFKASLVQGVFSFISGQIAKTGPEAMTITTPVATIGIRGTTGAINLPQGEALTVVLTADQGGTVGEITVFNGAGVQVLNQPFQATNVAGLNLPPSTTFTMTVEQFNSAFAQAVAALPPSPSQGGDSGDGQSGEGGSAENGGGTGEGGAGGEDGPGDGNGEGEPGAGGDEAGLQTQGEEPTNPLAGVIADLGGLSGLTGAGQQTISEVINEVINNLVEDLLGGPAGGNMGSLLGDQFGAGEGGLGDMFSQAILGAGDDDDDPGNTFFTDFQEELTATTGDDTLTGGDDNTNFVMEQGFMTAAPSGTLGGTDTVDGGDGIDQITFDGLWQMSGCLDGATSKLYLWNWSGGTPLNPEEASTANAVATIGFTSIELFYFGSYDGSEELQLPNFTLGGDVNGEAVAGGEGDDVINAVQGGYGWNSAGWFANAGAVVAFGGGGDDVIFGGNYVNKLSGGDGDDQLYTPYGDASWLEGGAGNDILSSGALASTMDGGAGDDTFKITNALGSYAIIGGENGETEDTDTADYSALGGSVQFTIGPTLYAVHAGEQGMFWFSSGGEEEEEEPGSDVLQQVERLQGTDSGDVYYFAGVADPDLVGITGGSGDDEFLIGDEEGETPAEVMLGDGIHGGEGSDLLWVRPYSSFTTDFYGEEGDDSIRLDQYVTVQGVYGGAGEDRIETYEGAAIGTVDGGDDSDEIIIGPESEVQHLYGGAGEDWIYLYDNVVVHHLDGGEGDDFVVFDQEAGATIESLSNVEGVWAEGPNGYFDVTLADGDGEVLQVAYIDRLIGGSGDDHVTCLENLEVGTIIDLGSADGDHDVLQLAEGENTATISNVEEIVGTDGDDVLTLLAPVSGTTIDLGGTSQEGQNELHLADGGNSVIVDNVQVIVGGVGTDTVTVADDAEGQLLIVENVERVVGGDGNDIISVGEATSSDMTITAGGGDDSIDYYGLGTLTVRYTSTEDFGTYGDEISGFTGSGIGEGDGGDILQFLRAGVDLSGISYVGLTAGTLEAGVAPLSSVYGIINLTSAMAAVDGQETYNSATDVVEAFTDLWMEDFNTQRLVVTGNGTDSMLWYWDDSAGNGDRHIDADELQTVAQLNGCAQDSLTAANFDVDETGYGGYA